MWPVNQEGGHHLITDLSLFLQKISKRWPGCEWQFVGQYWTPEHLNDEGLESVGLGDEAWGLGTG